jgi:4-amino-4-deoxy-L-arabinose transferase-like glycosyltransferase
LIWAAVLGVTRIRRSGRTRAATILLLCWAGFCIVFFSTSKSKLPGYILPTMPALGLLLARSYVVFVRESEKSLRWTLSAYSLLSLPAGVGLIAAGKVHHGTRLDGEAMIATGCVLLAFALANLLLALNARIFPKPALCVIPVLLLIAYFRPLSRPWFAYDPSGRTLAAELAAAGLEKDHFIAAGMKRGQLYSLNFYLHREVEPWAPEPATQGYLLVRSRRCHDLVGPYLECAENPIELGRSGWFAYRVEAKSQ